jgi:hypothetical protein
MDKIRSSQINPLLRECLAVQSTLRDLGYRVEDLTFTVDDDGRAYVSLITPKKNVAVLIGQVEPWEASEILESWEKVADAWNDNRIIDPVFILNMSKVQKNVDDFVELLKGSGIIFPGPELMN